MRNKNNVPQDCRGRHIINNATHGRDARNRAMCLLLRNIRTTSSSREPFICRREAVRRQIRGFSAFQIICCDTADCAKRIRNNHFTELRNGLSYSAKEAFRLHGKGFTAVHKRLSGAEKKAIGKKEKAGMREKHQPYDIKEQQKRRHGMPERDMRRVRRRSRAHRLRQVGVKIFYCPSFHPCAPYTATGMSRTCALICRRGRRNATAEPP